MNKYCFWLILLLLCSLSSFAQKAAQDPVLLKKELRFYLIDEEAGLSNNTINSLAQDSLGFIWVGTEDGLNRYDGSSFSKYKMEGQASSSLLHNHVQQLWVHSGKVWISTNGGLSVFDIKKESFQAYTTRQGLIQNYVNSTLPGPAGTMLVGVYRGGVQVLQPNQSFKPLLQFEDPESRLSSNEVSCMALQGDSVLWVGTFNGGLDKVKLKDKKVVKVKLGQPEATAPVNRVYTDKKGNVWIATLAGLHVITPAADTIFVTEAAQEQFGLSDADVLSLQEDDMGNMWIGTRNGGLNIVPIREFLKKRGRLPFAWYLPREDGESVYNRTISSILKDRNGNMWLGTSTGLNFVDPQGEKVRLLRRKASSRETLAHSRISALEKEANGNIWIGTDGGGLNLLHAASGKIDHFQHSMGDPASLSNNYILALKKDIRGWLWVGTYRGGLNRLDTQSGKITGRYLQGPVHKGSDVRCIMQDSQQRVWVGTNRGGLYLYQPHLDAFTYIEKVGALDIRDIDEDNNGGLWLSTYGDGIGYYQPEKDSLRFFSIGDTPGLTSNSIYSIAWLNDQELMAGTQYGGLVKLNLRTGKATALLEKDGLPNNTVNSLILEDAENLWMGTLSGIAHLHLPTNKITSLAYPASISPGELNINAALRSSAGYLYYGGNKGIAVFHTSEVKKEKQAPPIVLTSLRLFNKKVAVAPEAEAAILKQALSHQKEIVLSYDQSSISLDFAALDYPFSKNISYSYILENYNNHWVESGNTGTANFSNLPPGKYLFKARASLAPDSDNASYTTLRIIITPPFWQTMPAYGLYFVVLILLLYGALKYYSDRVKLQNSLHFEKKQRQLEHDLNEERSRFFTSFSHELKTPLTLILAPVEDLALKAKGKEEKASLHLVQKNARYLLQLLNKLLEFRKTEVGLNELKLAEYKLSPLLANWLGNYQHLAYKKKINLSFQAPEEEIAAWVDLEKLQIIVYNLLSNAFKFTPKQGTIELKLFMDEKWAYIQVQDSGIGIPPADLPQIFDWYYKAGERNKNGTGIGLALSRRLAELHHGSIEVESKPNEGSCFTISLPLDQELPPHLQQELEEALLPDDQVQEGPFLPEDEFLQEEQDCEEKIIHTSEGSREVLLLIDDNPGIVQYLTLLLKEEYHIITAQDGQQGFDKACQYVPDLIISDVSMPGKNGIELCKSLKQHAATTHIPVILLTVNDNLESMKEGFEGGADQYVTKPFNGELLLTRVKSLLNKRRQLREYFLTNNKEIIGAEEENSPLFQREKSFLESLESTILTQIDAEEANVEAIAHAMGMSRPSLYRKIKAVSGQNINEFIRTVKLNRALKLMNEGGLNVSQAAHEVGFSSVKHFRKLFKDQFGKLPSDLTKP